MGNGKVNEAVPGIEAGACVTTSFGSWVVPAPPLSLDVKLAELAETGAVAPSAPEITK